MAINVIAATIALLMVTKMLYQIEYVHHEKWNVNCTVSYDVINIVHEIEFEFCNLVLKIPVHLDMFFSKFLILMNSWNPAQFLEFY